MEADLAGGGNAAAGDAQQGLGEPRRQLQEEQILHLVGGAPEALADELDELQANLRPLLQQRQHVAAFEHRHLTSGECDGIGVPILAVEQGQLAKDLAGMDDVEHDLLAVRRWRADAHLARDHRHHAVTGRALEKDHFAGSEAAEMGVHGKTLALVGGERPEERAALQHAPCIFDDARAAHGPRGSGAWGVSDLTAGPRHPGLSLRKHGEEPWTVPSIPTSSPSPRTSRSPSMPSAPSFSDW